MELSKKCPKIINEIAKAYHFLNMKPCADGFYYGNRACPLSALLLYYGLLSRKTNLQKREGAFYKNAYEGFAENGLYLGINSQG